MYSIPLHVHTYIVHAPICYAVTSKGFYHSVHNNTRVSQVINPKIKRMKIVVGVLTLLMFFYVCKWYIEHNWSIIGEMFQSIANYNKHEISKIYPKI